MPVTNAPAAPHLIAISEGKRQVVSAHLASAEMVPLVGLGGTLCAGGVRTLEVVLGDVLALAFAPAHGKDGQRSVGFAHQIRALGWGNKVKLVAVGTTGIAVMALDPKTRKGKNRNVATRQKRPIALIASYEGVTGINTKGISSIVQFDDGGRLVLGRADLARLIRRALGWADSPGVPEGTVASVESAEYLGGFGAQLVKGVKYTLHFTRETLFMQGPDGEPSAAVAGLSGLGIGGAGEFQTGGGFVGGGFGVRGALEGIAFASILNAVTTQTHREVVISIAAEGAELYFVNRAHTPQQLRIELSEVLAHLADGVRMHKPTAFIEPPARSSAQMASIDTASPITTNTSRFPLGGGGDRIAADELAREHAPASTTGAMVSHLAELARLRRDGHISEGEFENLKEKLLSGH